MFEGRRWLCLSVVWSFIVGAVVTSKGKKLSIKLVIRHGWGLCVWCLVQGRELLVERGSSIEVLFGNSRRTEVKGPALEISQDV